MTFWTGGKNPILLDRTEDAFSARTYSSSVFIILERSEESQGGVIIMCHNYEHMKEYFVYIMSNKSGTFYTGVTNNLQLRVYQHKNKLINGFTKRYNINKLVYFASSDDVTAAIAREKQIKGMLRSKKIGLIKTINPDMKDLSEDWFDMNRKE